MMSIIDECVDNVGEQSKKKISVSEQTRSLKDIAIEADPLQIKEVFCNILNNACDAVPAEGGKIEVTGIVEGGSVAVHVNDNGSGIAKENLEKVFNPFFSTKAKGTGLGLSVCQQIVSFHKGSIDIKSEVGKGTAVTVRLPRETCEG
jgi:signal transduction histidine kinase